MNSLSIPLSRLALLGVCLLLTGGCLSPRSMSTGHIGCPPNEIQISDERETFFPPSWTWTASCRGKRYFCSRQPTGQHSAQTSCAPAAEAS